MTAATATTKLITAAELLAMGDIGPCELLYGELVMMSPPGFGHGEVAGNLFGLLWNFVTAHELGSVVTAEAGFIVQTEPDVVRAPDVAFVRKGRRPKKSLRGFFPGVPDLAVEVISPNDTRREIGDKVNMWLAHGTTSVWVADPDAMTITIHRTGQKPIRLSRKDVIRDEPLFPGLVIPLSEVYRP
jgi:Uma2 family endonuclease